MSTRFVRAAVLLLLAVSAAPATIAIAAVAAEPRPDVRPGFYDVAGTGCTDSFGTRAFLPHHGRSLLLAGGRRRRVALLPAAGQVYAVAGTPCTLTFSHNDPARVGVGARVLAHRGDARVYPANTMPAFEAALVQGFAGFELDVHLSSDGIAMVTHDDGLGVATDCRGSVRDRTGIWLRRCTVLRSPLLPESRILARRASIPAPMPTLSEVLGHYLRDVRTMQIVVDIKVKGRREMLVAALRNAMPRPWTLDDQRRLTFISLDRGDIPLLRAAFPAAHIAYESNRTISGLIDEPEGDHWSDPSYDTFSLSFNSLFDWRLKALKLFNGENMRPGRRFRRLYAANRQAECPRRLLGWTIDNGAGVRGLTQFAFHDVLTDLSYEVFIRHALRAAGSGAPTPPERADPPPGCPGAG